MWRNSDKCSLRVVWEDEVWVSVPGRVSERQRLGWGSSVSVFIAHFLFISLSLKTQRQRNKSHCHPLRLKLGLVLSMQNKSWITSQHCEDFLPKRYTNRNLVTSVLVVSQRISVVITNKYRINITLGLRPVEVGTIAL